MVTKAQQSTRSSMEPSTLHQASHSQPLTFFTSVNFQIMHLQSPPQILVIVTCHMSNRGVRKEKTASANEHIGHYKVCAGHPQLSWLMFLQMEIPDKTGYSPRRHQLYIDLMILKKSRNFLLSKQRTLGLLDSEFNHSNGRMGKNLMDRALCQGCIAPEQLTDPTDQQ